MLRAQQSLCGSIERMCREDSAFAKEVEYGKMFGILLTEENPDSYLAAYSGQICGKFDMEGFVPGVCDYLAPDGYFKTHEAEISELNKRIEQREKSEELRCLQTELKQISCQAEEEINGYKNLISEAKKQRDKLRETAYYDEEKLIRESQFMKAELHRKKLFWKEKTALAEQKINDFIGETRLLKLRRQHLSDQLQRWLFSQFVFCNHKGDTRNLLDIYSDWARSQKLSLQIHSLPPSGSGECCEPKLLHYAHSHGLTPREMGMFWWGAPPRQEVRRHLEFYPACFGKCRPILAFLLGEDMAERKGQSDEGQMQILYEDNAFIVVSKPAGMLSVPGKSQSESVFSLLQKMRPDCRELQMVHRLDMDTSGLLVVAKTDKAHKHLQRQFALRKAKKCYTALLEHPLQGQEGTISLPMRPDNDNRPMQIVDREQGKEAVTEWISLGENRVLLSPKTGRTHQLRLHCAHQEGLSNPIKGDPLYGKTSDRLCLHATILELVHPETNKRMTFRSEPEF